MQHDFLLIDRSGSMETNWAETVGAINSYVHKLASNKVDTGITLIAFDADGSSVSFDVVRDRITPATWRDFTKDETPPRGYTPLNDSIAKMITKANEGFNSQPYDKVAIIIVTDGMENASKEFRGKAGQEAVKKLLDGCRAKGWQVIFLGADFDNTQQAHDYGNLAGQTIRASGATMDAAFTMTASKRAFYGTTGQSVSYSGAEKAELAKDDPLKGKKFTVR